jgi:hypothetical protein
VASAPPKRVVERPELGFIIIGAQKGGTTSLWRFLKSHPRIGMPNLKETPLFLLEPERIPKRLETVIDLAVGDCPEAAVVGKAAAQYMMGLNETPVEVGIEHMAMFVPEVKLVALLRDPIDRAMSHYRMLVRRGLESRSFDQAVEDLLQPENLHIGRARPTEINSYLAQGEYARVLQLYLDRFPAEQIHIETTADLGREPAALLDRVLSFLGLPGGYRPEGLGEKHHVGGMRQRLDREGVAQLHGYLDEHVWPMLREGERFFAKAEFSSFMHVWNVIPDDQLPPLAEANRGRLEAHYRPDSELLVERFGVAAPWLDSWSG